MIETNALREKVLDLAIRGKLVPQDPNDEPSSVLLERIRAEKQRMVKDGKIKAKDIKNDTIIFKGEDNNLRQPTPRPPFRHFKRYLIFNTFYATVSELLIM